MRNILRNERDRLLAVAFSALLAAGWSLSSHAQVSCTIENWQVGGASGAVNLTNANAGSPNESAPVGGNFRRYGGPCAMRVPVDGTARYVRDGSPSAESAYLARFYVFLDSAGNQDVRIFEALDSSDQAQFAVWYLPGTDAIALDVATASGTEAIEVTDIGNGWHSILVQWSSGESAVIGLGVNEDIPTASANFDTSGRSIHEVRLGNVIGVSGGAGAYIDFDDMDSRRISVPERLLVGDANNDGVIDGGDNIALLIERLSPTLAPGQPDCNEDGVIDGGDNICLLIKRLSPQ